MTRKGTPVAATNRVSLHRFVPRDAIAQAAATAPRIDAKAFRADLDALVDQTPTSDQSCRAADDGRRARVNT